MKTVLYSISLFVVSLALVIGIVGQEKVIMQSEFSVIKEKADEKLFSKPHRIRISVNEYSAATGLSISTESNVTEYLSSERKRFVSSVKTDSGVKRTETIWIGDKVYTKEGSNDWKKSPAKFTGPGMGSGPGRAVTVEYIFKGKKILNNQKADVYEVTTKMNYQTARIQFEEITREIYWLSENDSWLKKETEFTRKSGLGNYRLSRIWLYEYNPKLNIEAPIK